MIFGSLGLAEDILSWCDKLASMPAVGFRLDPHFLSGADFLNAFAPILDKLVDGETVKFTLDRIEPFSATFTTEDGFQYGAEPQKVFVSFQHRLRPRAVSGGLPVLQLLSQPAPFTQLLTQVCERLSEAILLVPGVKSRKVVRVGVVASTKVADEDLPPGIVRFIKYVGRPWKGVAPHFAFQITADVGASSGSVDRCVHSLSRLEEDRDKLVAIQLDWQRIFSSSRAITPDSIEEILLDARKASAAYFEDLAEGNRFDEDVLSKTT